MVQSVRIKIGAKISSKNGEEGQEFAGIARIVRKGVERSRLSNGVKYIFVWATPYW
ncbi:hypothetical protein P4S95_03970 [Aneurinibacillus aneurinilyticus]|jgi:hypothetical protein|uniref:Uncharacterized protein n=1 Tax=Aneurinibacillus aneurinilyticus TaxID=1391 RepID=A0A848D1T1_ANEAE|nr:hypothetical protein [Aneurinibacillus aneurinilyticus]MED0669385.1 hypothetical protein [Aneurinibacillus aneurinilyticus]NMF01409.1 hypothetical protein [Aneurinibacillus aneurinilyticus]